LTRFWPWLTTTARFRPTAFIAVTHRHVLPAGTASRSASYVLLSKGDYGAELDIPLPFCLVTNNIKENRLELMPAYWWLYNMYALARNPRKFAARDKRKTGAQHLEFDFLAPDTAEEIFTARRLIELWTGKAALLAAPEKTGDDEFFPTGRELLISGKANSYEIFADGVEKSRRPTLITKASEGYAAYGDMLLYYAVKTILAHIEEQGRWTEESRSKAGGQRPEKHGETAKAEEQRQLLRDITRRVLETAAGLERCREWTNLGGQIVPITEIELLRNGIKSGSLDSWDKVHALYDLLRDAGPQEKLRHALVTLRDLLGTETISTNQWRDAVKRTIKIQQFICDQVFLTRKKDDDNPFRQATYRSIEEMNAVIAPAEENEFVLSVKEETEEFRKMAEEHL